MKAAGVHADKEFENGAFSDNRTNPEAQCGDPKMRRQQRNPACRAAARFATPKKGVRNRWSVVRGTHEYRGTPQRGGGRCCDGPVNWRMERRPEGKMERKEDSK